MALVLESTFCFYLSLASFAASLFSLYRSVTDLTEFMLGMDSRRNYGSGYCSIEALLSSIFSFCLRNTLIFSA